MNQLYFWNQKILQRDLLHKNFKVIIEKENLIQSSINRIQRLPRLTKLILNIGLSEQKMNGFGPIPAAALLSILVGQKVKIVQAKNSIAFFSLQSCMPIGCNVVLRSFGLFQFLELLQTVGLARFIDFSGFSFSKIGNHGELNFGISNLFIFPNIQDFESVLSKFYRPKHMLVRTGKKVFSMRKPNVGNSFNKSLFGADVIIHNSFSGSARQSGLLFSGLQYPFLLD